MKRLIAVMILFAALSGVSAGLCEDRHVFVLCNPKTTVNVRRSPKKGSEKIGWLDFGDQVITEGESRNGFLKVYGVTEDGEGWIFAGNLVEDQPKILDGARAYVSASGRVMSYRWAGGGKNGWLSVGTELKVYAIGGDWAVTNRGYVKAEYLDIWYEEG